MIRTIVSMEKEDKRWLDSYSRNRHISSAEAIRRAVRLMRKAASEYGTDKIISGTAGLWKNRNVDAIEFVRSIRSEWDEREGKISR